MIGPAGGPFGLTKPVRAFVALPCPEALRASIAGRLEEWRALAADVAWVRPETCHLTLRFLGDADPGRLEALAARLERVAASAEPVEAAPGATGAFPGWSRPRVLWVRLESGGAIERLAAAVETAARAAGFDPEERPFTAHLTLGRVRGHRGARSAANAVRAWEPAAPRETIPAVVLYRSELAPNGARHTALARYAIG
jgi:2'-5' RNA ligase